MLSATELLFCCFATIATFIPYHDQTSPVVCVCATHEYEYFQILLALNVVRCRFAVLHALSHYSLASIYHLQTSIYNHAIRSIVYALCRRVRICIVYVCIVAVYGVCVCQ